MILIGQEGLSKPGILRGMKVPGTLALIGLLLLVVQLIVGTALNTAVHDGPLALAPLLVGLVALAAAFVWGMVNGPALVRWMVGLGLCSVVAFGDALAPVMGGPCTGPACTGSTDRTTMPLAISAAFFVLAVTQGVRALMAERAATRDGSNT